MANTVIDREKLRKFVRKQDGEVLLIFLDRAIDLLPVSKLDRLFKDYARSEWFQPSGTSAGGMLEAVKQFHAASLAREYYEEFAVNWRNCTHKSRGTQSWIAECHRLIDLCIKAARKGEYSEAREGLDLIFDLLYQIDEFRIDIIFFADEGGSEAVGVDWQTVLPVWFRCLAQEATLSEYWDAVRETIAKFARHDKESLMAAARRAVSRKGVHQSGGA